MPIGRRPYAHENPFRAARIESLSFYSSVETSGEVWARFRASRYRGAIIGPHGSGKTTLVEELLRRAAADSLSVRVLRGSREGSRVRWHSEGPEDAELLVVDGLELFPLWRRLLLRRKRRVLVTSHSDAAGFPIVCRTKTDPEILAELTEQLAPGVVPEKLRRALYNRCSGNLREVFRLLYDSAHSDSLGQTSVVAREPLQHI